MTPMRCDRATTCEIYAHGAALYDGAWSPVILPLAESVVRELDIARAARVVDVGAGTGALTPALAAAAPDATIVSLDPATEMLRFAVERRAATAVLADAMALPIPAASVDAVLLAYMLFMLSDPQVGLREARRVLRPFGQMGTVTWANEAPSMAAKVWDATLEELEVPAIPAHSNHSGLDTTDEITTHLVAAGLQPVRVWYEDLEHTFDPDTFWRLRTEHGTNVVRLAALDDSVRARVLAELQHRLAQLARADYAFRGTLVCAVAEKRDL
jgi:SAM-dependent methyltransferase